MSDKIISPKNIADHFDNKRNGEEGFGVFLVQFDDKLRLEMQKRDDSDKFESDKAVRDWFHMNWRKIPRLSRVADQLREKAPGLFMSVCMRGL